jgi:hypothetical protein
MHLFLKTILASMHNTLSITAAARSVAIIEARICLARKCRGKLPPLTGGIRSVLGFGSYQTKFNLWPREMKMDTRFAAAYIGYSPATLRLWRRKGSGPKFYNVGRFIEYHQEDLDAWSGGEEMAASRRAERRAKTAAKVRSGRRAAASDFGTSLGNVNLGNWS